MIGLHGINEVGGIWHKINEVGRIIVSGAQIAKNLKSISFLTLSNYILYSCKF